MTLPPDPQTANENLAKAMRERDELRRRADQLREQTRDLEGEDPILPTLLIGRQYTLRMLMAPVKQRGPGTSRRTKRRTGFRSPRRGRRERIH